jgi:hypothetical protein
VEAFIFVLVHFRQKVCVVCFVLDDYRPILCYTLDPLLHVNSLVYGTACLVEQQTTFTFLVASRSGRLSLLLSPPNRSLCFEDRHRMRRGGGMSGFVSAKKPQSMLGGFVPASSTTSSSSMSMDAPRPSRPLIRLDDDDVPSRPVPSLTSSAGDDDALDAFMSSLSDSSTATATPQPIPNNSTAYPSLNVSSAREVVVPSSTNADVDDDDPLEAFMAGIKAEVKKDAIKSAATAAATAATALTQPKRKAERVDDELEREEAAADKELAKRRKMELARQQQMTKKDDTKESSTAHKQPGDVGYNSDDDVYAEGGDDGMEYDEDGNPLPKKRGKNIAALAAIDHSKIKYAPFRKSFYTEHPDVSSLDTDTLAKLYAEVDVKATGRGVPRLCPSFEHVITSFYHLLLSPSLYYATTTMMLPLS